MQRFRIAVPILLLLSAPLSAQQPDPFQPYDGPRRLEVSVTAGYFWSSDWSNLVLFESLGAVGDEARRVLMPSLATAPGAGGQAAITYWKGRLGFRLMAAYSESCVTSEPRCGDNRAAPSAGGNPMLNPVEVSLKTYSYGVQGIVGMSEYSESQFFRPYFLVGMGGVTFDPDESLPAFLAAQGGQPVSGVETVVTGNPGQYTFAIDQAGLETRFSVALGLGTDLRLPVGPGGLSLRFEVADYISKSPLGVRLSRLSAGSVFDNSSPIEQIDLGVGAVHNLRGQIGLAIEFGVKRPEQVDDGFTPFPMPRPGGEGGNDSGSR
jgi:hypothetical protein